MPVTTHILPKNENTEIPSAAFWLDTESTQEQTTPDVQTHQLWFGWVAFSRRKKGDVWTDPDWFRFTEADACWQWITARCRAESRTYLFAHNTSFDLPLLHCFRSLQSLQWTLRSAVIQCPPTILTFRRDKATLKILDTLNFWRMSLRQLGELVGSPKLDMPGPEATTDTWDAYCRQDVLTIRAACIQWWQWLRANDFGGFAPTLAGQALRTYRHKFMTTPILIDGDGPATRLARESYLGGRVECRRIGVVRGPIHYFDINSLYPSVMRDEVYPIRRIGFRTRFSLDDLRHCLSQDAVIARVTIKTTENAYPVTYRGRGVYPVGEFIATLTTPELRYALERGDIQTIHEAAIYEPGSIFTDYVDTLYQKRMEARVAGQLTQAGLYKLLLNSLYGKFGQSGHNTLLREWIDDPSASLEAAWDVDRCCRVTIMQLCGLREIIAEEGEGRDAFVAIAAHVTAYGRSRLRELIAQAGGSHVFYYDTDSVMVDSAGAARLADRVDPDKLGWLKREGTYARLVLHGPKDYQLGPIRHTKGVRASARWEGESRVVQEQWPSLRGQMRRGVVSAPTTVRVRRVLTRQYTKGRVTPDGRVLPFVFALTDPDAPGRRAPGPTPPG